VSERATAARDEVPVAPTLPTEDDDALELLTPAQRFLRKRAAAIHPVPNHAAQWMEALRAAAGAFDAAVSADAQAADAGKKSAKSKKK
jgi:hypothetical protein